jgi:hypothetical protein
MLTSDSIEERVWETLRLKKSLFAGVFDSPTGEVSFAKLGRKTVFDTVKEIFADQPGRPKPAIDRDAPVPLKPMAAVGVAGLAPAQADAARESITGDGAAEKKQAGSGSRADQILSGLVRRDSGTNRPVLSIPLPESVSPERLSAAVAGLVNALGRSR